MTRAFPRTVPPDSDTPLELLAVPPVTNEPAEALKEVVSTLLSAVAMVAMATGVTWGIWPRVGPFALFFGGALLTVFLMLSDAARRPKPEMIDGPRSEKAPVPGPSSAGALHAKGPGATP